MRFDPDTYRGRSIRLPGYDYGQAGAYFVTVCTQQRTCLFGAVADGAMHLNDAGQMVEQWWAKLPTKFPSVVTDDHVTMPNHFHGIIVLVGAAPRGRPDLPPPDYPASTLHRRNAPGRPHGGAPTPSDEYPTEEAPTLGTIMDWFKTMTTNAYMRGVKRHGWPPFDGRLWQRTYYDHIIRDQAELDRIRDYITTNPARWAWDHDNQAATRPVQPAPWVV